MHIYAQNLTTLFIFFLLSFLIFTALLFVGLKRERLVKGIVTLLFLISFYGILSFTVLGRTSSATHTFVFIAPYTNEFFRELYMNAQLYYPFGLTLTVLIGPWSILVALLLSVVVESWQYFAGTGLAQGTDVIMNTLGAFIGSLPYVIVRIIQKKAEELNMQQKYQPNKSPRKKHSTNSTKSS